MFRITATALPAFAMLWSATALADLVIDIPDVPVFTLSDAIVSEDDVFINALPGTELIIDAPITAPNLTVVAGIIRDTDQAEFNVTGSVSLTAAETIELDDTIPDGVPDLGAGGDVVITPIDPTPPPIVLSEITTTTVVGGISVTGTTQVATGVTNVTLNDSDGVQLGNITVTATTPITVNSVSVMDAGAGINDTAAQSIDEAEVPIAVLDTNIGALTVALETASLPALETDLGGGGTAAETHRSGDFAQKLFSCPQSEPDARFDEGSCAWAIAEAGRIETDMGTGDVTDTTYGFALGAQTEVASDFFAGAALGYDSSDTDTPSTTRSTDRLRAGLSLKYDDGAASLGLVIAAGFGSVDTARQLTGGTVATGSTDGLSAEARLRAAYGMTFAGFGIEPSLALSILHMREDGYTEVGPALITRTLDATDTTTFGIHPAVTFGSDFIAGPHATRIRPELSLGLDWYSDPDFTVTGTGATGRALFQTVTPDQLTGSVSAGVTVFAADDVALRLRYGGRFGENTTGHGGEIKLTLGF